MTKTYFGNVILKVKVFETYYKWRFKVLNLNLLNVDAKLGLIKKICMWHVKDNWRFGILRKENSFTMWLVVS